MVRVRDSVMLKDTVRSRVKVGFVFRLGYA